MNFYQLNKKNIHLQKGSALMLALFIIVVLTLLGGALMKVLTSSSEAIAQEVIGTRAYMAANSAIQAELAKLFPLNSAASTCNANFSNDITYDFSTNDKDVDGLYHCKAETSCTHYATHPTLGSFYRITSTGTCGSGILGEDSKNVVISSRTLQVEARSL
ncbi:MAG: hemophore-related protein [Colwellia sp.]|nr:hemophore-related protein [Colwellia sp.]